MADQDKQLVSADTLNIEKASAEDREAFYKNLDADRDKFGQLELTQEEVKKVEKVYRRYSTGLAAAVPLRCDGENCPFSDTCPYFQIGKVIIGEECKFEYDLINFYTRKYMEEFDVNPNDFSEVMLISELVELNIYEIRASKTLAKPDNAELEQTFTIMTASGDEMDEQRIHNAFTIKEKIKTRRMKILDALVATRKEKLKVASTAKNNELNTTMAELKEKISNLMRVNPNNVQGAVPPNIEDTEFEEIK